MSYNKKFGDIVGYEAVVFLAKDDTEVNDTIDYVSTILEDSTISRKVEKSDFVITTVRELCSGIEVSEELIQENERDHKIVIFIPPYELLKKSQDAFDAGIMNCYSYDGFVGLLLAAERAKEGEEKSEK